MTYLTATERYRAQLTALARGVRATRILEIGGGPEGVSGRAFCEALGVGGQLWTIDMVDGHPPAPIISIAQKETGTWWRTVVGDSLTVGIERFNGTIFDLLYIDGAHDETHASGDYARFSPSVRKGGLIVFDDFTACGGVNAAVYALEKTGIKGVAMCYDPQNSNSHYVIQV